MAAILRQVLILSRRGVAQVLVQKRKDRNPFQRTHPYLISCHLLAHSLPMMSSEALS